MMLLLVGGHSRGDLQACAVRAQGGQLKLYDHDHLTKVTQIIHHPRFNASLSVEEGVDVALMRLETPVMPSHHVGMVSLPPASLRVPERQMCWVTGWGYIRLGAPLPPPCHLQEVEVPVVGNEACNQCYENASSNSTEQIIRDDKLCAGK
ncbi:mastin-like isoform X8 [Vicugna pacos]|uniref:Mastin-like isoform X8 n=1 Tax=Vicugna pacos TaxID=30538 RepID=A0ABM5BPX6_VICPA